MKFIDLFCGIGGFHQAVRNNIPDAECILASDIDPRCRQTYKDNYGIEPHGDIKAIDLNSFQTPDLICGGFPCQAWSVAQWKDDRGFNDPRGTLFFDIMRLVDAHPAHTILLENVSNLLRVEKGAPFKLMCAELENRGYKVSHAVLSPLNFGIPQNRERVYIVATKSPVPFDFAPLLARSTQPKTEDIMEVVDEMAYVDPSLYTLLDDEQVKTQKSGLRFCGYFHGNTRGSGANAADLHLSRTHKQVHRIYSSSGIHPTISSSETSGRYYICDERNRRRVRKVTVTECYRMMGYSDNFKKHPTKGTQYRQVGNSVCIPVVTAIVSELITQNVLLVQS